MSEAFTTGSGFRVTTRAGRLQDVVQAWTLAFTGLVFFNFALKTSSKLYRKHIAAFYLNGIAPFALLACLGGTTHWKLSKRFGVIVSNGVGIGDMVRPRNAH